MYYTSLGAKVIVHCTELDLSIVTVCTVEVGRGCEVDGSSNSGSGSFSSS